MHNENIRSVYLYNGMIQNAGEYLFDDVNRIVTVDFSSLSNGIYFIRINNRYWKKIIKYGFEQ
jgi:hypothetical protein